MTFKDALLRSSSFLLLSFLLENLLFQTPRLNKAAAYGTRCGFNTPESVLAFSGSRYTCTCM